MLEFRHIGIEELHKIRKIAYEAWPNTYGQVISNDEIIYMLELIYNEESLKKQMLEKRHNFILAERDTEAIGFTSYEINYISNHQLMIHKIYLVPSTQGLGIGSKLLNLLSEIALQNMNNQLRLKVFFQNTKAIQFYEKYGFKKVGTEMIDIGNNYIILDNVMVKQL